MGSLFCRMLMGEIECEGCSALSGTSDCSRSPCGFGMAPACSSAFSSCFIASTDPSDSPPSLFSLCRRSFRWLLTLDSLYEGLIWIWALFLLLFFLRLLPLRRFSFLATDHLLFILALHPNTIILLNINAEAFFCSTSAE